MFDVVGIKEWALADMAAAKSLCKHSDNPSDEILEMCNEVSRLTTAIEIMELIIGKYSFRIYDGLFWMTKEGGEAMALGEDNLDKIWMENF